MSRRSWTNDFVVSVRFVSLLFGVALIILGLVLILSILETRAGTETAQFFIFFEVILALSILAGGVSLVHSVRRSIRIRVPSSPFLKIPKIRWSTSHTYGFTAALALGLGATLGSPLFILVPVNVLQYGIISITSLVIAGGLSLLVARLYARMYKEWDAKGRDCTGGPSFTKHACGRASLRYFIASFGMWIGNTALAAYSLIIFANYARFGFSQTMQPFLDLGAYNGLFAVFLIAIMIGWFMVNAFFEKPYAKIVATVQIGLTVLLTGILLFESGMLAGVANRPVASLFALPVGDIYGLSFAIVANTAFLFLLFFGFQGIQALSSDLSLKSSIPVLSFMSRFRDIDRVTFAKYAMIGSVIIASIINIVYALAVYVAAPDLSAVSATPVPGVQIALIMLGPWAALFMGFGFIIASLTTFVPTFLASSRFLRALSSDGFFPRSVGNSAWLFSLAFIVVLSLFNADFLVRITDFGILVAMAFVSFSAIWSRKPSLWTPARTDILPTIAGLGSLIAAGALYFVDPSAVLFGIVLIMGGYLIFDIFELGSYGSQLFLAFLYLVLLGLTGILSHSGTIAESLTARVSLRLIQNTLQTALVVFGINLVLGARPHQRLRRRAVQVASIARVRLTPIISRLRRLRRSGEQERVMDQWIRLMSSSEQIASRDPETFALVRRHLEQKLADLRDEEEKR